MGIFSIFKKGKKENDEGEEKKESPKIKDAVRELKEKLEHCCD